MTLRTQRAIQALILAGLGLYLLQTIWSGTLYWYINQRFLLLILAAAIGFLALASLVLPARPAAESPVHDHDHDDGHDHDHAGRAHSLPLWGMLIVAVPLILGVLVPARPLGASAVANKGFNTAAPLTAGSGGGPIQLDLAPNERNVLDWVRAFNYAESPAEFAGQPADVIGFIYRDSALAEGEFLVSRFAVTCCSADATAVGLLVLWPGADALQENDWVRVTGPISVGAFKGRSIPAISAEFVHGIDVPAQPYLYP